MNTIKTAQQLKDEGYVQLDRNEAKYFAKRMCNDTSKVQDSCLENGGWLKHDTGTKYDPHCDGELWLNVYGRFDGPVSNRLFEQVK